MHFTIPKWLRLQSRSKIIYCNYHFATVTQDCTCFLHWCVVFHQNRQGTAWNFCYANEIWMIGYGLGLFLENHWRLTRNVVFMPPSPPPIRFKGAQKFVCVVFLFFFSSAQCNFHHFIHVCCLIDFRLLSIFGTYLNTGGAPAVLWLFRWKTTLRWRKQIQA